MTTEQELNDLLKFYKEFKNMCPEERQEFVEILKNPNKIKEILGSSIGERD